MLRNSRSSGFSASGLFPLIPAFMSRFAQSNGTSTRMISFGEAHHFVFGTDDLGGAGNLTGSMRQSGLYLRLRGRARRGRSVPFPAGTASFACSPNVPSPIAALLRTSGSLSLRASMARRDSLSRVPFRSGRVRTATNRSRSLPLLQILGQFRGRFLLLTATGTRQHAKQHDPTHPRTPQSVPSFKVVGTPRVPF